MALQLTHHLFEQGVRQAVDLHQQLLLQHRQHQTHHQQVALGVQQSLPQLMQFLLFHNRVQFQKLSQQLFI
jgi:hypothetical protein